MWMRILVQHIEITGIKDLAVRLLAICATVAILSMAASGNAGAACPPAASAIKVTLTTKNAKPVYDYSLTVKQIERMAGPKGPHHRPVGLTQTTLQHGLNANIIMRDDGSGRRCAYLTDVDIHIGYVQTIVYIAREYRPNSCQYRAIREHEDQHVRVYLAALSRSLAKVGELVSGAANSIPPMSTSSMVAAKGTVQARLDRAIASGLEVVTKGAAADNAALDTPRSYARIRARCRNW